MNPLTAADIVNKKNFFITDNKGKEFLFEKEDITYLYIKKTDKTLTIKINKDITIKNAIYCNLRPFPNVIDVHKTFPNIRGYELDLAAI